MAVAFNVLRDAHVNLTEAIRRYQNPLEADKLARVTREVEAVRQILQEDIDKV